MAPIGDLNVRYTELTKVNVRSREIVCVNESEKVSHSLVCGYVFYFLSAYWRQRFAAWRSGGFRSTKLYKVTTANIHDSEMITELIDKKDKGQKLYADSAYRSEEIERALKKKNIISKIHEKGYRNRPLTKVQRERNRRKSKIRARVEHIFGFMTNSMNRMYLRCRNFARTQAAIGLMNITYNLFRLTQLKVSLQRV